MDTWSERGTGLGYIEVEVFLLNFYFFFKRRVYVSFLGLVL